VLPAAVHADQRSRYDFWQGERVQSRHQRLRELRGMVADTDLERENRLRRESVGIAIGHSRISANQRRGAFLPGGTADPTQRSADRRPVRVGALLPSSTRTRYV